MGGGIRFIILLFLVLLQFLDISVALPLCTDSRAPYAPNYRGAFCAYNETTCCNYAKNMKLKQKFFSMNVSDTDCASLLKSILCARCDPFSAELFRIGSVPREVPVLCNSTVSQDSTQSLQSTNDFCSKVWNTCQNVSIVNSPFSAALQGRAGIPTNSSSTKLTNLWQSQSDFCDALGGASDDGMACFAGEPVTLNSTGIPSPTNGMCLEKIGNGSYINMVAHPDGSNRALFSNQQGVIWLATIPDEGSGGILELETSPFLDLTDEVHFDTEFGLLGIAFHPKFMENGRFFASFSCDKANGPNCDGRCACNSDVNCDPAKLSPDSGAEPCRYQSVIAEFTVNGSASQPSMASRANPSEVRRIFTMGLPFTAHHGGQILFGPNDGYLYFMMGDGGGMADPYNFSQNKRSLLGKIMRFDIDKTPSSDEVNDLDLWGNYSIPVDNPYANVKGLAKEIWAMGFRNPWRCCFDSIRPSYFLCADVGQYEEVNLITKEGNYGWRVYEGPYLFSPSQSPGGNTTPSSIKAIFPVMGYNRSDVNTNEGSASITGGYFYRSTTDPCMYGKYLYADLYGGAIWVGSENPINSGKFVSSRISFNCAHDTPVNCSFSPESSLPALSYIFSFGEDNNKDVYLLTNSGVYRIVRASRCNYTCAKETTLPSPGPDSSPRSEAGFYRDPYSTFVMLTSLLCLVFINYYALL
ncbi:HIPL1 protein-like isoform X2 [Primulina huaijiensis]|uniref:HIPL1 protein-like isoform X2 n=1 Tax=Primulina huaijiensis TaxID=1492673 RepID=UPI003CC74112